jgi:hypothetical protein
MGLRGKNLDSPALRALLYLLERDEAVPLIGASDYPACRASA